MGLKFSHLQLPDLQKVGKDTRIEAEIEKEVILQRGKRKAATDSPLLIGIGLQGKGKLFLGI